jgi:DNA-binding NtrC family response regulator
MKDRPVVLIIDEEPRMCESLKLLLVDRGYRVKTATVGHEALTVLNEGWDLLVLDIDMPGLNGIHILDQWSHNKGPFIIISGYPTVDSVIAAFRKGALDYIRKPFDPDEIMNIIHRAFHETRLHESGPTDGGEERQDPEKAASDGGDGGAELILIVDHDERTLEAAGAILGPLGYRVLLTRSGKEAMYICEAVRGDIDLLIIEQNLVIRGGGTDAWLRSVQPTVRIVFSTEKDSIEATHGHLEFLHRPFDRKTLPKKIREKLDGV